MILLFGEAEDAWIAAVASALVRDRVTFTIVSEANVRDAVRLRYEIPRATGDALYVNDARIALDDVRGVLVRFSPAFLSHRSAGDDDAGYRALEWSAATYGLLDAFSCPVFNRLRPAAPYRSIASAFLAPLVRAAGFSLPTVSAESSVRPSIATRDTVPVLVIGEHAFGTDSESLARSCVHLVREVGLGYAELTIRRDAVQGVELLAIEDRPPDRWCRDASADAVVAAFAFA